MSDKFEFTLEGDEDEEAVELPEFDPAVVEAVLLKTCPTYRRAFLVKEFGDFEAPFKQMREKLEWLDQWLADNQPAKPNLRAVN